MKNKKLLKLIVTGLAVVTLLTGCGSSTASSKATASSDTKVKKIKVAYDQASKPMSWLDENGNPTGYDVETMKLVDELLPQYEFEYVGTTSDDLLLGVEQGKYRCRC